MTISTRRPRSEPEKRNAQILDAAIAEAIENNYQWITRGAVAARCNMSPATVSLYGDMLTLKRAVLHAAVAREVLPVIAQGLVDKHAITETAPADLKRRALASLTA